MINSQNVDALALVLQLPASAAFLGVPAGDGLGAADVGEAWNLALGVPAVLCDEAVLAVGAGEGCEGARGLIVAGVVGDCCCQALHLESGHSENLRVTAEPRASMEERMGRIESCMFVVVIVGVVERD